MTDLMIQNLFNTLQVIINGIFFYRLIMLDKKLEANRKNG